MTHPALRELSIAQAPWDQMHVAVPHRLTGDFATIHADVVAADGWVERINYLFLRMDQCVNRNDFSLGETEVIDRVTLWNK